MAGRFGSLFHGKIMKYADISPTMRAFLGGREAFRKLGFRSEDLYCLISRNRHGVLSCFVKLKAQGKEFNLEVGPLPARGDNTPSMSCKLFADEYKLVCDALNSVEISAEDCDRIWQESEAYQKKLDFVLAVTAKGFVLPRSLS
jgi:hypothetical protein